MTHTPIAVGGIGGSGTRVIARIITDLGFYLGSELSAQNDNLWFALLFGRRDILVADEAEFAQLTAMFFRQMSRPQNLDQSDLALLQDRLEPERIQHEPKLLRQWHDSFLEHGRGGKTHDIWGWKVPYTHVVLERLLRLRPELKYIHLTRDGLDMAFSHNQNQLLTWGPIYLNRNVSNTPADALAYWCAVHRRMARMTQQFPDRVFNIDFGQLINSPKQVLTGLLDFIDVRPDPDLIGHCSLAIKKPATIGRYRQHDTSALYPQDIEYLRSVG